MFHSSRDDNMHEEVGPTFLHLLHIASVSENVDCNAVWTWETNLSAL